MKRLAVIPTDPIAFYIEGGYNPKWLEEYYNPGKFFDEVYLLSPKEENNPNLLGMKVIKTKPEELKNRLRELKIDVVRAYGGYWACDMACLNKVPGIPVIVSVHDTNPRILHDSIASADAVLSMSQAVKKLVLTKFKKEDRAWILPNRIHEYMYPRGKDETRDLEKQYPFKYKVLHVGRKVKQKNLDNLIKALKILGNDYCVIAVGKGNNQEYADLAKQQGVSDRYFSIDTVRNEELPRYFSFADCMCNPSRWEGFGIVLIEALASEAVLVVSDIPEIAEAVTHEHNGLLIKDYENPQAIADSIRRVCTDEALRSKIKKNARPSVERFEQSKVDAQEVAYYQKVLEMNRQGVFRVSLGRKIFRVCLGQLKRISPKPLRQKLSYLLERS